MENRTELDQLGEFGLIRRISTNAPPTRTNTVRGIGDDAAVLETGQNEYTLLSTELLLEGIHFDLSYTPLKHLGYKIVTVGVSDILAMNGIPQHLTVSLGLSNRFSVEAIDELYAGIRAACAEYEIDLVGGDTTPARAGLALGVTVVGSVEKDRVAYRNGAQPNDILCLSGDVGGAYLGLQLLEREKQVFLENPDMQPQLAEHEYVVQRQLRPDARLDVVQQLRELGVMPTAMIDVSDGLASDLLHLCAESKVGAKVFEEQLPIHDKTFLAATELSISPITAALNGGEDYELLFTIRQQDYQTLLDGTTDISFIGYLTAEPGQAALVTKAGEQVDIIAQGWEIRA
ncbi:MAG: thiamine-phosphate kinase [Cytophagaceae bacterium]|nr:thiamine-phosphate kinase [Cytophagaceae bacterium]